MLKKPPRPTNLVFVQPGQILEDMILNALVCTAERVPGWREEEKGHKKTPISA